jgi:MFS family permease
MHEYLLAVRAFSPSLRRLLLANALITAVVFGVSAVLFNLYLLRLGLDVGLIGLVLGIGQVVWAATALPAGLVSSRIGLRNGYMLGAGCVGLGMALALLVESQPAAHWIAWLIFSQTVGMLGASFITVNNAPYMMTVTGELERRHAFAVFQAVGPAAAFVGSVVAGLLPGLVAGQLGISVEQAAPYRLALWLGPVLCFLAIVPLLGADPGRAVAQRDPQAAADPAPLRLLVFFGFIIFMQAIGEGAIRTFFNVFLDAGLAVLPAQIGAVMGVAQLLPVAVALSIPFLLARLGTGYTLLAALVGISVCLLPLAAGPSLGVAAAAYMSIIAMSTITGATRDLLGQESVTPRWRTTIQSTIIIGLALGWALIGVVGGYLIDTVGFWAMFLAGAICVAISAMLLVGFLRMRRAALSPSETLAAK